VKSSGRRPFGALAGVVLLIAVSGLSFLYFGGFLAQADGNPYALVEMVRQVAGDRPLGLQAIRDLHHGAGVRYLDITPVLLLLGAVIVAARFVALGLNDPDLYIIAGSLGALFFVARYFLYRGLRRRG